MKLHKLLLGAAVIGSSIAAMPHIAKATTTSGTANVLLRAAITLVEDTVLDFGEVTPNPSGDVITISSAGATSAVSGSTFAGSPTAGAWTATGSPLTAATISFSSGDVLSGTGTDMALGTYTHDGGASPAFDGSGDLSFNVGASLTIATAQTAGSYTGSYSVTVDYQ